MAESGPRFDAGRARQTLAWCAAAGALLVFIVIVASAFLRHAPAAGVWPDAIALARLAHRVGAVGAGVLVLAITAVCFTARRHEPGEATAAAALVALTVFLSVLGRATPGSALPAVTVGNVLGGMAMLGLLWWLRLAARETRAAPGARGRIASALAWTGVALVALELAMGALLSAWWPAGETLAVLDPRAVEALAGPAPALEGRGQSLHMAHRFAALLVLAYWAIVALAVRSLNPVQAKASAVVVLMLVADAALGAAVARSGAIPAAVAHNAWAALLLLAAVHAAFQSRLADAARVSAACQTVTSK